MTMIKTLLSVIALTTAATVDAAFVPASSAPAFSARHTVRESAVQPLNLFDSNTVLDTASNMWLATIDADIAAIPDNEFAPIFMGGIIVMFGGVLSALMVGFILERGNLYASVVADSYAQGGDNEEFWAGLSETERIKAEDVLQRIRDTKGGTVPAPAPVVTAVSEPKVNAAQPIRSEETKPEAKKELAAQAKPLDMFSDYE